jgi:hypothetical protein
MAGSLQLTTTSTFTGQSAIDMTGIKQDIFNVHLVTFELTPNTDNALPSIRYIDTSDTVITATNYDEAFQELQSYSSFTEYRSTANGEIRIAENVGNATNESCIGAFYIFNAGSSSSFTFSTHQGSSIFTNGNLLGAKGIAVLKQTDEIKGFRVFDQNNAGGTFDGTISVFGVK